MVKAVNSTQNNIASQQSFGYRRESNKSPYAYAKEAAACFVAGGVAGTAYNAFLAGRSVGVKNLFKADTLKFIGKKAVEWGVIAAIFNATVSVAMDMFRGREK